MRPLLTAAIILIASPAVAAPWVIDPASTLTFSGTQAKEPFTGKFTKFTPVVEFDPQHPTAGKITVTVDMASATIDDKDKQESLPTADWFATAEFPTATFTSTRIDHVHASPNDFIAEGPLTLRGISQPVVLAFTFQESDGTATVDGNAIIQRNAFGVGQGQWKSDEWIAYPVEVKFHLIATNG